MKSLLALFLLLLFFIFAKDVRSPTINESSLFNYQEVSLEQQQVSSTFCEVKDGMVQ